MWSAHPRTCSKLAVATERRMPDLQCPGRHARRHVTMLRHLFLIGYDISCNRRRRRALRVVKGQAIGGQKSLYECWLTAGELQAAMGALRHLIDPRTDRVMFVRLDPRATVHTLGVAVPPEDGEFFYAS